MSSETTKAARANVELVRGILDDLAEEGLESAVELFDPEVEVYSTEALANAGTYHGIGGVLRWAERWFDAWEEFEINPVLFEPVGVRHVVVSCRQVARGRASGVPVEMDATYLAEISAGRVIRFHLYATRADAIAAARAGEPGLSSPS
jgi:ketosteroid isomerase-like protein